MLVIGLTGGVASGKSTVAELFSRHGVPIIDADVVARDVLEVEPDLLPAIVEHFGSDIVDSEGKLIRSELGRRIFSNVAERLWLEALLHPRIIQEIQRRIDVEAASPNPWPGFVHYCIVVIPLLIEMGDPYELVDRVMLVDTPFRYQISRLQQRDHLSSEEAVAVVRSQATREERRAAADDLIMNDQDEWYLKMMVDDWHKIYSDTHRGAPLWRTYKKSTSA